MKLLEEIKECFASKERGAIKLSVLPDIYPAWYIRLDGEYGVAVPYADDQEVSERFSSVRIHSCIIKISNVEVKLLYLSCSSDELRNEFATICAEFIEPGQNGINRKSLINEPVAWWKRWRELLGNVMTEKQIYSVIGEMLVFEYLYKCNQDVEWTGPESGSHDIESDSQSFEVKSTTKKYGASITISGQHQLMSQKPLFLYFCRLEKSRLGNSVNEILERLVSLGCNRDSLEKKITNLGFEKGSSIRDERYKILEKRQYVIDEKFPKIVNESFKNNKIPDGIIHIKYSIDLDNLCFMPW